MAVENQSTSSAVDCDPDSTVSASFGHVLMALKLQQ